MVSKAIFPRLIVTNLISAKNLTKTYGSEDNLTYALNNASIEIKKGEFVAIIGPSGSGKSTLMHILGCLDKPSSGNYLLNGEQVSHLSENSLAKIRNKQIGFVFQSFNLLPRTSALKNVELPLIYSDIKGIERIEKAKNMLFKVGLSEKLNSTPAKLSGGQQQRVAIARALVNDADIIMADEPTGNLDSKSSEEIMELIKGLNREGKTIIIITHEKEIAQKAKRIITVKDGKIVSDVKTKSADGKRGIRTTLKAK